jgi:mono/diheme cytochrome c family protein
MIKISLAIILLMTPLLADAWPWSKDMANQISTKPEESPDPNNPGMTPFPSRSVPVPGTVVNVKDIDAAEKLKNPIQADEKSVRTGGQLFAIYCVPCHGKEGKGDGYVGQKFLVQPPNLAAQTTKDRTDGYIWAQLTYGRGIMPTYGNDLNPTERWHVVNYVRSVVQKSDAISPVAKK